MNKKDNIVKRIVIILIFLAIIAFILIKAQNYLREGTEKQINLVINNNNVTERLKNDVKIKDGIIYVSMDDVKNFFDKYIYIEDEINEIVTTYDKKIASIGFDVNKLTINGSIKKIYASAMKEEDTIYLPLSEMKDVYNIEISNMEAKKVVTVDSLEREQIKAYAKSKLSIISFGK